MKPLCARIPEHTLYVEVFCGSAKLLFAKEPSKAEVINDINGDVANFFRVAKHRPAELAEALEAELVHPERFRQLRDAAVPIDELERALRFAYTTWYSFGSQGGDFARPTLRDALKRKFPRYLSSVRELLERTAERLDRVRIEQRDFAEILTRFDSPETFFYVDPPYVDFSNIGQYDALTVARRRELFGLLGKLQGSCLVSFDDHPEIVALAHEHGLGIERVETRYSLGGKHRIAGAGKVTELLLARNATWPIAA